MLPWYIGISLDFFELSSIFFRYEKFYLLKNITKKEERLHLFVEKKTFLFFKFAAIMKYRLGQSK